MNEQTSILTDIDLDIVAGGKAERHQVTKEEYEKILGQMIADNNKNGLGICPR